MRFVKRPVEIEAVQWSGFNFKEIQQLAPNPCDVRYHYSDNNLLEIWNYLEGCWVNCPKGHWVIKGIKREVYPCDPEVFEATYEAVTNSEAL